jgi:hypothetical protein
MVSNVHRSHQSPWHTGCAATYFGAEGADAEARGCARGSPQIAQAATARVRAASITVEAGEDIGAGRAAPDERMFPGRSCPDRKRAGVRLSSLPRQEQKSAKPARACLLRSFPRAISKTETGSPCQDD